MKDKAQKIYAKFGANERFLVDKIKNPIIKDIAIILIGVKVELQWTGWLQYLIPVPPMLLIFIISLTMLLLGASYIGYFLMLVGGLLLAKVLFDIVTVRYKIRLPETIPQPKNSLKHTNVFESMLSRRSCRSYQIKKLREKDLDELKKSLEKHLEEPKFSSGKIRFEYISVALRVWPVVNGSEFLVALASKDYNRLSVLDVGKTLQKVVLDATKMGIATCWIGPGADHKSITTHLGKRFNSNTDNIICVCALGYKSAYIPLFISIFGSRTHRRLPINSLFFEDYAMEKPIDITKYPFKKFAQVFEAYRWPPSSYNAQTTRGIAGIEPATSTMSRYYAAVATGIWCANWELGCDELGIKGKFKKLNENQRGFTPKQAGNKSRNNTPVYDIY